MKTKLIFGDKPSMLENLYALVLNQELSEVERTIFLQAKNDVESGKDIERVARVMKRELSPIVVQGKANDLTVDFLIELATVYSFGAPGSVFIL